MAEVDVDKQEKILQERLAEIAEQERILQEELNEQKGKSATIERDVNILSGQIQSAQLNINKKEVEIKQLDRDISLKEQTVEQLNAKLERGKIALAEMLRRTNQLDQISLAEVVLAQDNLSEFFAQVDTFSSVRNSLDTLFDEIREIRGLTEEEKIKLAEKQNSEINAKYEILSTKKTIEYKEGEKKQLLSVSKNAENIYESILEERRAEAASIRAALFQLRDSAGISFGDALTFAQSAGKRTGVRPAFILGILKQESNIGQNVGSCIITDLSSGSTRGVNSGTVFTNGIHPTRDLPILQTVMKDLGRDPLSTRVSCPFGGGYGGAMGPSQFIPSTWVSYIGRLQSEFGAHPDPWNPEHAITATAMFVSDLGASAQTYTAEQQAAGRYYAGGNWQTSGLGYAASVLAHAATFQQQIDFLADVE